MAWTVDVDLPAGGIVDYKFAAATQKGRGVYTHTHQHNHPPTHPQHINIHTHPHTHTHAHAQTHTHTHNTYIKIYTHRQTGGSSSCQQCVAGGELKPAVRAHELISRPCAGAPPKGMRVVYVQICMCVCMCMYIASTNSYGAPPKGVPSICAYVLCQSVCMCITRARTPVWTSKSVCMYVYNARTNSSLELLRLKVCALLNAL
jgi:hypothetical protein